MKKVAIEIRHIQELFNGEFGPVIEFVKLADEMGVDQVSIADHVVVHGDAPSRYPGPEFPLFEHPQYEPVAILSGLATVTKRIRLSMGVMISPLRPAILLVKQLATRDVLSRGRLDAGFGAGWQHEEYDAEGLSFEGRFARMEEQIYACRALWSQWPASHSGKTVQFENLYSAPLFDYRLEPTDEIMDSRRRCYPFSPARPPNAGIAILLLKSEVYGALVPWTKWKEEQAWSEMVVPYVEAGYPGPLPFRLVSEIISVEQTEDPQSCAAMLRRIHETAC